MIPCPPSLRSCLPRVLCVVCIAMAFLALVTVSGCNRAASPAGVKRNTIKIGVAFQEMDNPYFVTMKKAIDEAITNLDAEVYYTDAHHDITRQISDIEDLIQKKIGILLINPTDSVSVEGVVKEAKEAGIVVVAVDAQANGPIDCFVGSKNYEAGRLAGEFLGKHLNGKGKVAILDGIPVVPILERVQGFKDAIAKFPGHSHRRHGERQAGTGRRAVGNREHDPGQSRSGWHLQRQ